MRWFRERADQRLAAGTHRSLRPRPHRDAGIDIASNDYLGLARDPAVIEAGVDALRTWGAGATASRLVRGHTELHEELESALASLTGSPAALVFSSGYLANLAAITALSDPDTLIVSDAGNHASIIDACRLARGPVAVYPHLDLAAARRLLTERREARALLVTDAVFSVDGDLAPLADLHGLAEETDAVLVVDEAHSIGVLADGAGACPPGPHVVRTATLSKAFGSQGGVVLGAPEVVDHLVNTARSFIFDTGLAPAPTASALAAVRRVQADPALPDRALRATDRLVQAAIAAGWEPAEPAAAVASMPAGTPAEAVAAAAVCAEHDVAIGCFRPPSVPDGRSRLRMTGHADLTEEDFRKVAEVLVLARKEIG